MGTPERIMRNNLKDSKRDIVYGCLNCGNQHPEIKAEVGTIIYCKYCDNYERIVHISETGISTSERLEKDELFQLLSEGRLKIVDYNDVKAQTRG
jgi:DNA-directed RNA polymerase subunit RPC12/RpoP